MTVYIDFKNGESVSHDCILSAGQDGYMYIVETKGAIYEYPIDAILKVTKFK